MHQDIGNWKTHGRVQKTATIPAWALKRPAPLTALTRSLLWSSGRFAEAATSQAAAPAASTKCG